MDLSSNSTFKESTFLSAIQSHFFFERLMISCCSGVLFVEVLIVSVGGCCAKDDCTIIVKRNSPIIFAFMLFILRFTIERFYYEEMFILHYYILHLLLFATRLFFLFEQVKWLYKRSCYVVLLHANVLRLVRI